ncbi:DUF3499 domain-containing protein [Propioniciclava soli]|uniref:DUF3499 domain-containing protein n=1 Tax=Propioniciclava soli TaxID=2775081 RepID=A0ABZ3C4T2_9ACTN
MKPRQCSRTGCQRRSVATLTYVYADSVAVVGPLALRAEPGTYDLCEQHGATVSTPRGWELIRLPLDDADPGPHHDDLLALADAVREVGFTWDAPATAPAAPAGPQPALTRRKGHLGVVADPGDAAR